MIERVFTGENLDHLKQQANEFIDTKIEEGFEFRSVKALREGTKRTFIVFMAAP